MSGFSSACPVPKAATQCIQMRSLISFAVYNFPALLRLHCVTQFRFLSAQLQSWLLANSSLQKPA